VRHLNQLKARLQKKPSMFKEYDNTFKTQLVSGIIAVPSHFLPHHGEDRDTTKLRIVFDGSAKADPKLFSLNDCLEKGQNLTPLVFDVLLKFRQHKVGIIGDIENHFITEILRGPKHVKIDMVENINSVPRSK